MKFICLTLLIISGITDSRSERYDVVGPVDSVFAVAGEDVILPCSVKPNISVVDMTVRWSGLDLKDSQLVHLYEDHGDRNTKQIESYRGRTELNHQELQRGDASLKLSSVRVSDEGRYKCFIQSKSWYDDATVDVSVEAVGRPPVITVDGFDHSERLHLQCESEGWYPEPVLEWLNSEGVSLSSETTQMQRNTDGFSVKHTITVHHRDDKIHCRVKLRHHTLETLIVTSSISFNPWRTTIILNLIAVALIVIAGILLAAFVRKNREHDELQNENRRKKQEHDQLQTETCRIQQEYDQLQEEKNRKQQELDHLQEEKNRKQQEYNALLQNENQRIKQELDRLLENRKQEFSSEDDQEQIVKSGMQREHDQPQNVKETKGKQGNQQSKKEDKKCLLQ
ncbi:butyrophilin-like protein 3 isoform X1 [Onychostoma macrolepis]|uniref:butyrophilin-like protein 3 isoform X1 n=1 Tax=Onychostoma macrolepis TaxID=369639 RepID=UPI00272A8804|nr:butyrophilin-like protein 3 isoform X1 [Onychostoma macrolepis]